MTVEKYLFWSIIQEVVNKLDNLAEEREKIWIRNFSFKENLDSDIKIFDMFLENRSRLNCITKK